MNFKLEKSIYKELEFLTLEQTLPEGDPSNALGKRYGVNSLNTSRQSTRH